MSKYTELRQILQEDICDIVELTLKHRLESVINTIIPSTIDKVADSIQMYQYDNGVLQNSLHLTMVYTDPVTYTQTTRPIGSPTQIVSSHYVQQMVNKINQLEGQIIHLTQQLNASTPEKTA